MAAFLTYIKKCIPQVTQVLVLLLVVLFTSCELLVDAITDDAVDTLVYTIDHQLTTISLQEDMDLEIIESDDNNIIIEGAKSILEHFTITNDDGNLSLNFDKFNAWMFDKPQVQLRIPKLCTIRLYGDNLVHSNDTLRSPTIRIFSDGNNDIHLMVNCETLILTGTNVSDFYASGKAQNLKITTYYGSAFYGSNLIAETVSCNIGGSNHQVVYPTKLLKCKIKYSGNIYYVHQPEEIQTTFTEDGIGKIIYDSSRRK